MKFRKIILSLLVAGFLAGCATTTRDIRVETDSATDVDFSDYTTYTWLVSAEVVNDPHGNWEPPGFDADAELRFLINRELRNKGMQEVTTRPDLLVAFAAGINMEVFEINMKSESEMYTLTNTPKGALVVVMIDAATRNPVWAGNAVGDVKAGRSSTEISQRLGHVVKTMFNKFRQ